MLCLGAPEDHLRDSMDYVQQSDQQSDMKGVIKLAKYVSWPDEYQMTKTTIMIAPKSDETYKTAEQLASDNKILNTEIDLKRISGGDSYDDETLDDTKIIFIEAGSDIDIEKIIHKVSKKQILTITNDIGLLEKGCMFYVKQDPASGQIQYLYNKNAIISSTLSISTLILTPEHNYEKQ